MKKKFLCLVLGAIIVLSFTSCDPTNSKNQFGSSEKMTQEMEELEDILNRANEETTNGN